MAEICVLQILYVTGFKCLLKTLETRQDVLKQSAAITELFYFSGLSFRDNQRIWVFRVWIIFETSSESDFLGSEVWAFENHESLDVRVAKVC